MSLKNDHHHQEQEVGAERQQSASNISKNNKNNTTSRSSSMYWTRLEDYCFFTALKTAVSAFPRSDFALTCLTSSGCPQPWRCLGNGIFVCCAYLVRGLLMGPYLVIDTLFIKPKLYRLYKRYLTEGVVVRGTILFRKPTTNGSVHITLVEYYAAEDEGGSRYLKYLAHHGKDEDGCSIDDEHCKHFTHEQIELLVLPHHPKSACSAWTAQIYVKEHATCQKCFTMMLWSIWMTLGVALVIAMGWQYETKNNEDKDCSIMTTLAVLIPTALILVCLYLYLRDDPVQQFLLESGKEVLDDDEEWGGTRNHVDEAWVGRTVPETASQHCSIAPSSSYLCGVPQLQDMEDRGDDDD